MGWFRVEGRGRDIKKELSYGREFGIESNCAKEIRSTVGF